MSQDPQRPQDPILATLSDDDRFTFQSRRYGGNNLWIMHLPSGKLILSTPARDPIAIIESLEHLHSLLVERKQYTARRDWIEDENRRILTRKVKDKNDEFADIEIDL